jgi:hypothetical protein
MRSNRRFTLHSSTKAKAKNSMIQRYHFVCGLFLGLLFAACANVQAEDWPKGYVVHKGTESPDGRYGIAVPDLRKSDVGEGAGGYVADLKSHQMVGSITYEDFYSEGANHRDLRAIWAPDSTWCVVVYEGRFGFDAVVILERKGSSLRETEIGKRIEKTLAAAAGDDGTGSVFFRPGADRRLQVRALYYTGNPKGEDKSARYARFEGTFDLNSRKWTKAEARKTKAWDALEAAYSDYADTHLIVSPDGKVPDGFTGAILASDKEKADYLDKRMNDVYQGARAVLPPERFEKVKKEQIEWLKTRDAASSEAEKCKLLEARIKALRDLLW